MQTMSDMIHLKDLTVAYGAFKAIDRVNLTVKKGETCAIIGPSGCGKTTMLYAMAGIIQTSGDQVVVDNQPLEGIRNKTSIILQEYGLFPWKTVWENAVLGLKIKGELTKSAENQVSDILKTLEILEHREKFPSQLSGGQKQRVAIARAWATFPDLLLMDEPFSSLDAITRENLQNTIIGLYNEKPLTMVLVTHSIEEAVFMGKKIILMGKGNGKINHIIENPHFGKLDFRESVDFYEMCLKLRKLMKEDSDGE